MRTEKMAVRWLRSRDQAYAQSSTVPVPRPSGRRGRPCHICQELSAGSTAAKTKFGSVEASLWIAGR